MPGILPTMGVPFFQKFENKLPGSSFVYQLLENVQELLSFAHYFPEYTLHDYRHISKVLELSARLIPDKTLEKLNPKSVEVLIGAIALHDLGMFIKPAGLKRLIFGEYKDWKEEHLDNHSWNKTWEDFYKKARRYTDRQLIRLFGDAAPVESLPPDDIPKDDTRYQRLLYGEFIRQNHHRLAFLIADKGLPGDNTDLDVFKNCNCDEKTRKIIGLVAQSHGMKLRDTEEFLKHYEYAPHPEDVPVFYLMTVLRMADYLHIGRERASKMMELADEMHSPESKRQFHLNQAIEGEPLIDDEHKSVNINADPDCSSTYEDMEDILRIIQQELDSCWAILAEKYAYKYELSIHRLTSNLFDENKIASFNDRFLTRRAALDVNPDIVKHLIGPLYDNNLSYGVRELIQNAVDACNERSENDKNVVGKIDIRVDTKKMTFEIIDNGIGMNEDILRNYYLVAGSSYRYSDAWRDKYIDDDGKSKIARTGRFGIGALASFLIGDEITVTTRHVEDKRGFQFTFSKEPRTLDVKRVDTDEPGTRIKIRMYTETPSFFLKRPAIYASFKDHTDWNEWYYFDKPEVSYYLNGKRIKSKIMPIPQENIDKDGWYDVKSNIFSHMKLGHAVDIHRQIIVNGIHIENIFIIGSHGFFPSLEERAGGFPLPTISLIDKDNKLDIDIKRTQILNFPEFTLAGEETFKYYLANLLAIQEDDARKLVLGEFTGKSIVESNSGYTLFSPSFIYHAKQQKVIAIYYDYNYDCDIINILNEKHPLFPASIALCSYKLERFRYQYNYEHFKYINERFKNERNERIYNKFSGINYWIFRDESVNTPILEDFALDKSKPNTQNPPLGLTISKELPLIIECTPTKRTVKAADIALKLLQKYIPPERNNGMIPFNMDKRKKLYPEAFSELERYMRDSKKYYRPGGYIPDKPDSTSIVLP
jgi:hypothetical protein